MAPHGEQVLIDCTTTFLLSIPPSLKKLWLLSYRFASQVFTNPCPPATSGDGWSTSPPSGTIILRLYENYGESSDRWAPVIDPPWERLSGTLKARGWRTPPTSQDSMRSHVLLVSPVGPRTLAEISGPRFVGDTGVVFVLLGGVVRLPALVAQLFLSMFPALQSLLAPSLLVLGGAISSSCVHFHLVGDNFVAYLSLDREKFL